MRWDGGCYSSFQLGEGQGAFYEGSCIIFISYTSKYHYYLFVDFGKLKSGLFEATVFVGGAEDYFGEFRAEAEFFDVESVCLDLQLVKLLGGEGSI